MKPLFQFGFGILIGTLSVTQVNANQLSSRPATPEELENGKSMMKMHEDMSAVTTGDADKDFVAMMLPHHQGAVDMAKTELKYGHDPKLLSLAREIIRAQNEEIATMKRWQESHGGTFYRSIPQ